MTPLLFLWLAMSQGVTKEEGRAGGGGGGGGQKEREGGARELFENGYWDPRAGKAETV